MCGKKEGRSIFSVVSFLQSSGRSTFEGKEKKREIFLLLFPLAALFIPLLEDGSTYIHTVVVVLESIKKKTAV